MFTRVRARCRLAVILCILCMYMHTHREFHVSHFRSRLNISHVFLFSSTCHDLHALSTTHLPRQPPNKTVNQLFHSGPPPPPHQLTPQPTTTTQTHTPTPTDAKHPPRAQRNSSFNPRSPAATARISSTPKGRNAAAQAGAAGRRSLAGAGGQALDAGREGGGKYGTKKRR
ncbi:hypothetical protein FA95DRAFT_72755 [Auriscalpium vulgare]|uniref:Uncharacterized protein n=1 Tax=Auriscalpium vulgare TaxID=40419 RepID=A0ACB8RQX8_9AGAM|nr:hypothetical protein FA95DRAFT_72755 [Auriscalpium vulgare]